jgi:hypothetical protein
MDHEVITPKTKPRATITLGQLEKSDSSSVWVLNNSNPKGNVNIMMNDGQGTSMVVQIPPTWIPIDLTTQATKSAITNSPNFRRLLSTGMLVLVDDEVAAATMAQTDAGKEGRRVYSRVQDMVGALDALPKEAQRAAAEGNGSVSGMAMQLCVATDLEEDQVMTTVQGNLSSMTDADLRYIAENSRFPRVKEYAAQQLTTDGKN